MLEKTIETRLRDGVKALGGKAYKFVSPGNSGVPDRLVCLPAGRMVFVELKAPGKTPRPLQKACHRQLQHMGHSVWVIDSAERVEEFLDWCRASFVKGAAPK